MRNCDFVSKSVYSFKHFITNIIPLSKQIRRAYTFIAKGQLLSGWKEVSEPYGIQKVSNIQRGEHSGALKLLIN